jgi:hypothetical protein
MAKYSVYVTVDTGELGIVYMLLLIQENLVYSGMHVELILTRCKASPAQ